MSKSKVKFIFKTNTSQLMMKFISQHLLLRYRRTVLGYLWTLINPLLMMAVLAFVFSTLFKNDIKTFAVFLFLTYPFYLQVFFFTDFELTVIRAVEPWWKSSSDYCSPSLYTRPRKKNSKCLYLPDVSFLVTPLLHQKF